MLLTYGIGGALKRAPVAG